MFLPTTHTLTLQLIMCHRVEGGIVLECKNAFQNFIRTHALITTIDGFYYDIAYYLFPTRSIPGIAKLVLTLLLTIHLR